MTEAIATVLEKAADLIEPGKHWSDCATHNEPAYPNGPCDCGGYSLLKDRGSKISQELVERMSALVREMVRRAADTPDTCLSDPFIEARAIVALLPVPVDPDLIEARELWAVAMENGDGAAKFSCAADIRRGTLDDAPPMVAIRQALGRELERSK